LIKKKLGRIEAVIPFSAIRKRSITAVRHPENDELIRIYIKGAPEYIVHKCTRTFDVDGKTIPMSNE
jgi:magnesium-transporting ATPase (P-type)